MGKDRLAPTIGDNGDSAPIPLENLLVTFTDRDDEEVTISGTALARLIAYGRVVWRNVETFCEENAITASISIELEGLAAICQGLAEHSADRADLDKYPIFWTLGNMIRDIQARVDASVGLREATVTMRKPSSEVPS